MERESGGRVERAAGHCSLSLSWGPGKRVPRTFTHTLSEPRRWRTYLQERMDEGRPGSCVATRRPKARKRKRECCKRSTDSSPPLIFSFLPGELVRDPRHTRIHRAARPVCARVRSPSPHASSRHVRRDQPGADGGRCEQSGRRLFRVSLSLPSCALSHTSQPLSHSSQALSRSSPTTAATWWCVKKKGERREGRPTECRLDLDLTLFSSLFSISIRAPSAASTRRPT